MQQEFKAIYENGVLRPLTPLEFQDHELLVVSAASSDDLEAAQADAARQQKVILGFVARMESVQDEPDADGFSNRDHDRILYGDA